MSSMSSFESPALVERLLDEARADRAAMEARQEQQRQEIETRLDAKEVKMEQQLHTKEMEQQRQEMEATKMEAKIAELTASPAPAISDDEQLTALQARIEGLHVTKLLTGEELFALEDLVADYMYVELTMSVTDRTITQEQLRRR